MEISKLLKGTMWTTTEILKGTMDTPPVTRNYQERNKATRFVRVGESICTLHLSFFFYFHGI